MKKYLALCLFLLLPGALLAQILKPDVTHAPSWTPYNRQVEAQRDANRKYVTLSAAENDGLVILNDVEFSNGTIEFDVRGKNIMGQSFVGIAFHVVNDSTFDAIYFRPFNFMNPDTVRRSRAVQYISAPKFGWEFLRNKFPGKYENKVKPVPDPDGWFHVKLDVDGKDVRVFVDNSSTPSLKVQKLTDITSGKIALWVGNRSGGSFANLVITRR